MVGGEGSSSRVFDDEFVLEVATFTTVAGEASGGIEESNGSSFIFTVNIVVDGDGDGDGDDGDDDSDIFIFI